ncbi:MAG: hypothetical protein FJW23_09995 [Acidimicrobiia bacterium]|nr:hypothetical protein [Acidimicrobiia bacterium]
MALATAIRVRRAWLPAGTLALLGAAMWLTAAPAGAVHVRWVGDMPVPEREALERAYLLTDPERTAPDTWGYTLLDVSRGNVRRLVQDPAAADTHGVDREAFTVSTRRDFTTFRVRLLASPWHTGVLPLVLLVLAALSGRSLARAVRGTPWEPWPGRMAVAVAFPCLAYVAYLVTNPNLSADESFSIWVAQAFLRGDQPYIDVFDAGAPGLWWLSALGLSVTGGRVIGEVAIAILLNTVGVLVASRLVYRTTGSIVMALVAGIVAAACAIAGQLYSYPKVVLYPVAVAVLWWFADRPTPWRTGVLGVLVAAAALVRHDHGAYVGLAAVAALVIAGGPQPLVRRAVVFGLAVALPLLPLLAMIQSREGLTSYLTSRIALAGYLGIQGERMTPTLASAWPLAGRADDWSVRVGVQWRDGLTAAARRSEESRLQLEPLGGSTEAYALEDSSREAVRALVRSEDVLAVRGVDALTYRPADPRGTIVAARNRLADLGFAPLPRVLGRAASTEVLYSVLVLAPWMALLVLAVGAGVGRADDAAVRDRRRILPLAVLLAAAHYGLVRRPGQVVETVPIDLVLIAWLAHQLWVARVATLPAVVTTPLLRGAAVVLVAVVSLTGLDAARAGDLLDESELFEGSGAVRARTARLWSAHTANRPIDVFAPVGARDDRTIVRYLRECTEASDRIWEPTGNFATPFYADRGVVQHLFWYAGFRSGATPERESLAWIERHRVPLIVIRPVGSQTDVFGRHPVVQAWIREHYHDVTSVRARDDLFTEGRPLAVLARNGLQPVRTFEPLDLPCFATP